MLLDEEDIGRHTALFYLFFKVIQGFRIKSSPLEIQSTVLLLNSIKLFISLIFSLFSFTTLNKLYSS